VESSVTLFSDCGLFTVYFGSDDRQAKKCVRLIDNTLRRLADERLRPHRLEAAKKQFAGQLLVGSESLESYALSLGKSVLNFGHVDSINVIADRIKAVTADEIREMAGIISGNYSMLTFV